MLALCLLGLIVTIRRDLLPLLHSNIRLSDQSLEAHIRGIDITVVWADVIAAHRTREINVPILYFLLPQGTCSLPLDYFNDSEIWEFVRTHVAPEALEVGAHKRHPHYREWEQKALLEMNSTDVPLQARSLSSQIFSFFCIIFLALQQ
jgi:hypothetical protein